MNILTKVLVNTQTDTNIVYTHIHHPIKFSRFKLIGGRGERDNVAELSEQMKIYSSFKRCVHTNTPF